MNKDQPPKHHRICIKCHAQSTGKSVKECEESFPRCGLNGGVPTDACKTTILQDRKNVFKLISAVDLEKLHKDLEKLHKDLENAKAANKHSPIVGGTIQAVKTETISSQKQPSKTPKNSNQNNSKKSKN